MKTTLITLLFTSSLLFSCISKKTLNTKIRAKHSPAQLQKDLAIVKNSLEQNHPGVYWYIKKNELDFKFDSLSHTLKDSLTALEFYRQLAPVVAAVKCGHTKLIYPGIKPSKFQRDSVKKSGGFALSQLTYFVDSNRVFIKSVGKKELDTLKGSELLCIDDVPVSEILKKTRVLFASDGYNQTFYNGVLNKSFDAYYYLNYGKSDSSKLTLKLKDSTFNAFLRTIKPVKKKKKIETPVEIGKNKIAAKQAKKLKRKNRYKGVDKFGKPLLAFKIDSFSNNTAVMTVKSFGFEHANFSKFFRKSFESIEEKKIDYLILDLRDNGGGNLMACNRLFRYLYNQPHQFTGKAYTKNSYIKTIKYRDKPVLAKVMGTIFYPLGLVSTLIFERKDSLGYYSYIPTAHERKPLKKVFNGDLKVLVNGYSFSATSLLSANLQSVKRGTFVGEETGGGYNQCSAGSIPFVNLPNTGLKLRLPLKVIDIVDKRDLFGRGVFPDVSVKENFEDVIGNSDVIMEEAKYLVKKTD